MGKALTIKQAERRLQIERHTIYRALRAGKLPGVKVGGCWRIPERALEEFLRGGGGGGAEIARPAA